MNSVGDLGPDGHILVVGGGAAGYAAAAELRRLGYTGDVSVACDESYETYDRPSCSKGLLNGRQVPADVFLDKRDLPGVEWRLGRRAQWSDPERRVVGFDTGETCRYDGLVIATGTSPVVPDGVPAGVPGLHTLHTLDDAWRIRHDLRHARRIAVVGGGLTGCEVASAVRALARDVVLVHPRPQVMTSVLGDHMGDLVTEEHRAAGVDLRLGTRVTALDHDTGMWRLRLDNDDVVHADMVVVTVGERAAVSWLADTGIDCSDGVLCDATLRVAGAAGNVVAAGAVARWPDARRAQVPQRVGHWIAALQQGRAAARTLLRGRNAEPFSLLPRFWTEQHGLRIQVCGRVHPDADIALSELRPGRRDTARAGVLATYYLHGQAIGVAGINAPHGFTIAARALDAGVLMPAGALPATESAPQRRRLQAVG